MATSTNEVYAAIAMALHEFKGNNVHDKESGIITIKNHFTEWNSHYTMTTEQLVRAAKIIKPKVVFPYHYGQTDVSGIPSQLQGEGIDVRIRHYE